MNVKTKKEKKISWDFCPISHEDSSRGVEVLASWHKVNANGLLQQIKCSFINIEKYIANISYEMIEKKNGRKLLLISKGYKLIGEFPEKSNKVKRREMNSFMIYNRKV